MNQVAPRNPTLLLILDGFGVNPSALHNGVSIAKTPILDDFFSRYPVTVLQASGSAVGLPDGQMGNSEVGHLTLGCGEIIRQDLVAIDDSINDGSFFGNRIFNDSLSLCRDSNRPVHLIGLVSDGGVHSHVRHLLALIELCQRHSVPPVLHMITDGRDTAPKCALKFYRQIKQALENAGGSVATVSGRYYAMDRDNRWERTQQSWNAMVKGAGITASSVPAAIEQAYGDEIGDEFILPTVIDGFTPIESTDNVIFFNFRKDRARQLTAALFRDEFEHFDRGEYESTKVTCMTEYDEWFRQPYAFQQDRPNTTIAEVVSRSGLKQFHCAETEKYAHVTYFLNGRHGDAFSGEDRLIVPSPKVATYDMQPDMSAQGVADELINAMESNQYTFLTANFANGDMVGHTGVSDAIVQAIEALDKQAGRVLQKAEQLGFSVVLTADHGNCELMVDSYTGEPHTQHTVFPVPCMIMDSVHWQLAVGAGISSIAPTLLHLMGLSVPASMNHRSLLLNPSS